MTIESKNIVSKKNAENSQKTLYELVSSKWFDFKKVVPYLAESFGVCTKDEYNKALHDPKDPKMKKNIEYNLAIRDKILWWEEIKIPVKPEISQKFTTGKQEIINKQFWLVATHPWFVAYINWLDETQINKLNTMSNDNFQRFLSQQAGESDKISVISKVKLSNTTIDQMKNIGMLIKFEEKFNQFIYDNPSLKSIALSTEEEVTRKYDVLTVYQKTELLNTCGNEEYAKRYIKLWLDKKIIKNSAEIKNLSTEKQQEFNQMMVDYYAYNETIGLWDQLKEIWWEDVYADIQRVALTQVKEWENSSIDKIKNEIVSDKNITEYFKKNQIEDLVDEKDKDAVYYKNLQKLYPEVNALIERDTEIQWLIKKEYKTDDEKNILEKKIQEKTKPSEGILRSETNEVIQKQAVISCLDMLKMYMDIDLTQQENVLDQFTMIQGQDRIKKDGEDVIVNINGTIQGKKLHLYYNLNTWVLKQEEFLARDDINKPFSINDPIGGKKEVEGIVLPKFQDFIQGAAKIDYKKVMNISADLNTYKKNVTAELKNYVMREGVWDIDTEKNIFQKTISENIAAQELFWFIGKDKNISSETCSKEENSDLYDMYSLLYNTLHYYTIDEIKMLRTDITKLMVQKEKYIQNKKEKDNNNEKYILGLLGNNSWIANQKMNQTNESLLNYASFFLIFKTTEANIPIIDLMTLEKFVKQSENEVSRDQSYLAGKDMKFNFDTSISRMETNDELVDLEKEFENLPGKEK